MVSAIKTFIRLERSYPGRYHWTQKFISYLDYMSRDFPDQRTHWLELKKQCHQDGRIMKEACPCSQKVLKRYLCGWNEVPTWRPRGNPRLVAGCDCRGRPCCRTLCLYNPQTEVFVKIEDEGIFPYAFGSTCQCTR